MQRIVFASLALVLGAIAGPVPVNAQGQQPTFAMTKVDGTDNVYVFRYVGHQALIVVTPAGVIATDPIGENRPAGEAMLAEIRKITQAPIRYVIYSHSHADHIAGGKPLKDAGATFVAHRLAKEALTKMNRADIVPVDETVDDKRTISLGGTDVELLYVGKNHSDNTLVVRLPRERIIFTVDFIPVRGLMFQNMPDSYLPDFEESIKRVLAMDWDRMVPGHGPIGTKRDVQDVLTYLQELSAEVKKAADAGKCPEPAKSEIKLPKYAAWANYDRYLAGNIERYCTFHTKGQ
jgi:glyoxylase-like metal-dependent hydrolase (beta-lactamase superfamily II)